MTIPLVSVVIPTHNRAHMIRRAVDSVLGQTFRAFELLVVDDASTDGTREVIEAIGDPRVRCIRRGENGGAAATRNSGIMEARGKYVTFLDDDDEYMPSFLGEMVAAFEQSPEAVGYGWCAIRRVRDEPGGEVFVRESLWAPRFRDREDAFLSMIRHRRVGTNAGLMVRRSCIDRVGLFDATLQKAEDTDYLIRLAAACDHLVVPKVLMKVHLHDGPRLTEYDARMADAYRRIAAKHEGVFAEHPDLGVSMHYKAAWLHYHSGDRHGARAHCRRILRRNPLHLRTWAILILFELFGVRAIPLHRRLADA